MTELIVYEATRYRCPHCRRSYAVRPAAEAHMARCFADPQRQSCKTCRNDEKPYYDPVLDRYDDGGCAKGLSQGPSCIECGEHPETCSHYRYRPASRLRVLCPSWEATNG